MVAILEGRGLLKAHIERTGNKKTSIIQTKDKTFSWVEPSNATSHEYLNQIQNSETTTSCTPNSSRRQKVNPNDPFLFSKNKNE